MSSYLSIPKPCSEKWDEMTPTVKGAHCAKCSKVVIDCANLNRKEIQSEIANTDNPCIRILQSQLDELNFLVWFGTLSLRKQLRYVFLFAVIVVFSTTNYAQDSSNRSVIEIDSVDELPYNEIIEAYELEEESEIIQPVPNINAPAVCGAKIDGEVIIYEPFIYGDITILGTFIPTPKNPAFLSTNFIPEEIIPERTNYMSVEKNNYTFFVSNDHLIFHANSQEETLINLKIIKADGKETIFNSEVPIRVPLGQTEVHLPIANMKKGDYIITIEGDYAKKSIEITRW